MLETEFLGNSLHQYAVSLGDFLAILLLISIVRRTVMSWRGMAARFIPQVRTWELGLLAFYLCTRHLHWPPELNKLLHFIVVTVLTYRAVSVLQELSDFLIADLAASEGDAARRIAFRNVSYLVKGLIAALGVLFALANFGVNISAMLAGLGIGGIAVALAGQAILADLFSAIAIYLDGPFKVGDFIEVEGVGGTVENIGVKTTRVRALSGEVLVYGNAQLTSRKISNYRQMRERRALVNFTIPYQTENARLKKLPALIGAIVSSMEGTRLERAHFKRFADSGLEFELAYYVDGRDYNRYMDVNQAVHFAILDLFEREEVQFAHPTRTLIHVGPGPTSQ